MFENVKSDLKRLGTDGSVSARTLVAGLLSQGFQAILVYRMFHWLYRKGIPGQPLRFLAERFIEITCGISIPARCRIGKGLRIHHFGGIILHSSAELGDNCTLYHDVTIGDRGGSGGAAKIGNNVLIGAGAKIIGEITIGDNCVIGANTVVTKDMEPAMVAVGSPCHFIPRKDEVVVGNVVTVASPSVRVMDFRGTNKGGGGPDKTVLNSAALHDGSKVDVLVVYLRNPQDEEFFQITRMAEERGIKFVAVDDRCKFDWRCLLELRRLVREHAIQVLHTHDEKTLLDGVLLRLMCPGLRLLHTCHLRADYDRKHFDKASDWYTFRLREVVEVTLMRFHHKPILAVSEDTRNSLIRLGLRPEQVVVMANGIDTRHWRRQGAEPVLRREFNLRDEQMLVGTVARIAFQKDLPTFYEVAARVVRQRHGTVFVIVGDGYGNELDKARADIEARGLAEVVRLTGHRTDLLNIYRSFDLFLMTSVAEGMPNTVLEAMALELPIVSTRVSGVPELIEEGQCGLLAPMRDADGLAAAVLSLLDDSQRRLQFGQAARARVEEKFDFAKRVASLETYYCQFASY
ncbi:MAG: glycosyltransferase [Desulfobulbus sp.]|nr:glycosyltransferase [Desulfobulbus sp.]